MKRHLLVVVLLFTCVLSYLGAQDNFSVNFTTAPDFLNVCGDTDDEVVTLSLTTNSSEIRSNITATAHLFDGMELVAFDQASSTPGVNLIDNSDPTSPIFGIPTMNPGGLETVDIFLSVKAVCEYIDTLKGGTGIFDVMDTWEIAYDLETSTGLVESDQTELYRDAIAFPIFNLQVDNTNPPANLNDCFTRTLNLQNDGIEGFVDSLVYEVIQGAGVYIQDIQIEGQPIAFSKSLDLNGDTVVTVNIGQAQFGLVGDNDGFMDPTESLAITESICLMDCLGDRSSLHNVTWGCESRFCETISEPDFVVAGQGLPDAQAYETGTIADVDAGYCQVGSSTITYINEGIEFDAGFATMLDISAGISLGFTGETGVMAESGFEIIEMYIGGVLITTPSFKIDLDNNPQFYMVDPDGIGGLTDFDGDDYYDDLPINEALEIRVVYTYDCNYGLSLSESCQNELGTNFSSVLDFSNSCGERSQTSNANYRGIKHKRTEEIFNSDTDAFLVNDVFHLVYEHKRSVEGFGRSCSDDEEFHIQVVLPTDVNINIAATSVTADNFPLTLKSNTVSNDTLLLIYDATPIGVTDFPLNHEIDLAFEAGCSAALGATVFPFEFSHYCPDCDCKHLWHCEEFNGPYLHTTNPPCPPLLCPVGVQANSFNVERTTFGFQDSLYTTEYDQSIANKSAGLACDSVEMTIESIVGGTLLTDSIGMVITYENPDGSTSTDETFIFANGNLRIVQGAVITNCPVDPSMLSVSSVDSTKTLNFDLNSCLTTAGITLNPTDSLIFLGKFTINPEAPAEDSEFSDVPNLRGYGYATVDGVDYSCDNYGADFSIGKIFTATAYPNGSTQIQGCQQVVLNIQVITQLNNYIEVFGFEHRPIIRVDSLVIDYDVTILESFDEFEPSLLMPGHPVYGNNPIPMPPVDNGTPGRYVVYLDTLNWGPSILDAASTYPFSFGMSATPNCQTDFGNAGGSTYSFNPGLSFYKHAYALDHGDGSCAEYIEETTTGNTIEYSDAPDMTFNPLTTPFLSLTEDTAVWVVQYCNVVNNADIGFTWLALEDPTGGIEVVSIEDVSLPGTPVNLPIRNYGTVGNNYIVYSDGLLRANGVNGLEEVCNSVRITAVIDECGTLDFQTRAGWNCLAPSEPDWEPSDYTPCVDFTMDMSLINEDPFLDANVITEPDPNTELCEDKEIVILLSNTQLGTVYDVQTDIILPFSGVSLVPGSVEIAYPQSAPFVSVPVDPVFAGTNASGNIYRYNDFSDLNTYLDENGLRGANLITPNDSNQIRLRYRVTTDCDFVTDQRTYFSFRGVKGCGDFSNTEAGETNELEIIGLPDDSENSFDIDFAAGSSLEPGETSTITVDLTNTNANATDASDFIMITLPSNIAYQSGSSVGLTPAGWLPGDPMIDVQGGFTTYSWSMPFGLAQSESASLSFQVMSPLFACAINNLDVGLFSVVRTTVTCVSTAMDCEIESITSSNNGNTTPLPVNQLNLMLSGVHYTSSCLSSTEEMVMIQGTLVNPDTDDVNATMLNFNYYYDTDDNGIVNAGDELLESDIENGPISAMSEISFSHSFALGLDSLCNIILQLDTTGLSICGLPELALGEPQMINAGADQLQCTITPTTIVTNLGDPACDGLAGYAYNWTAIAPASTADLSATNIASPVLTVPHDALVEDTLQYVLATSRVGCGGLLTTQDTVNVIRGLGVSLNVTSPVSTNAGVPVALDINASFGTLPYTYSWSPSAGLDNPNVANPMATVFVNTTYTVTVTSATGCEAIETVEVLIENCINPVANSVILTQTNCGGSNGKAIVNLAQDETGYAYSWNPDLGSSNATGNERTGLPAGGYTVVMVSLADGACTDSVQFAISSFDGPAVDTMTTAATCVSANGTASLSPDSLTYNWSDGGNGALRNDLAAGIYFVTAYDAADPACTNVILVEVDQVSDLDVDVVINQHATDCSSSDGSATINVSGGSGSYGYSWSSGTATNNNLSNGYYQVTITDLAGNGCEEIVDVVIHGGTDLVTVAIDGINNVTCPGADNGEILYTLTFDPSFTPGDTMIVSGADTYENGNLSGGDYCILISDNTGCIGGSFCFTIEEAEEMQLLLNIIPPCPDYGSIDLTVHGGTPDFIYDWADIPTGVEPEDRDSVVVGIYSLVVTDANGCFVSENQIDVGPCANICDYFFGETVITNVTQNCNDLTTICLDIISDDIDQFVITDNGMTYTGNFVGCNFDTTYYYEYSAIISNLPGPYRLLSWNVNGVNFNGEFADFNELTDSMNVWDPNGNWVNNAGSEVIEGGAMSTAYGSMMIESLIGIPGPPIVPYTSIDPNSLALEVGVGNHTIVVRDTIGGCSDTLVVNHSCPPYELQYDVICLNEQIEFDIDLDQMDISGPIASVINLCPESGGESVDFKINEGELKVSYLGLSVGTDTACIQLESSKGALDTIYFYIGVEDCENLICDTVYVNQTKTFCLDASNLAGPITSITNDCPDESGTYVQFEFDLITGCVDYSGIELGQDTACVIYCDAFANCDTTYFCIETVPYYDLPIANDDTTSTDQETPVVIDFKENDILYGGVDTAYVLFGPNHGTIGGPTNPGEFNLDCTATYTPDEDQCEIWDQFTYVVCNPNGCDTATVFIWIACSDIIIYTAVSPNNDGVNDVFYIAGISEYPDNEVEIFNRWGNRVYSIRGYNNEWFGQWQDRQVPDGTYFYMVKLNDRENRVFSGYLELYR